MRSTLSHGVSSLFLAVVVSCALGEGVAVRSASQPSPTIPVEVFPFPTEVGSVAVWSSMTCTRDDQIIVGICHTNEPAYLVQFDDASRRFVAAIRIDSAVKDDATWRVKQAKIHTQLYELSDGWVYGGTH